MPSQFALKPYINLTKKLLKAQSKFGPSCDFIQGSIKNYLLLTTKKSTTLINGIKMKRTIVSLCLLLLLSQPGFIFAKQVAVTVTGSILPSSSPRVGEFGSDAGSYSFEWANKQVSTALADHCSNGAECEVTIIVEDEMGYIEKLLSIKKAN